jgi:hypothetical protein
VPLELELVRLVDYRHTALAERLDDAEAAERRTGSQQHSGEAWRINHKDTKAQRNSQFGLKIARIIEPLAALEIAAVESCSEWPSAKRGSFVESARYTHKSASATM